MRCMGSIAQDYTGFMACLGAEPKVGKGRGLGDLKEEKMQRWGGGESINTGLVSTLAWFFPASDQHSLSCLLIKFLSNSFLDEGLLILWGCQ